VSKGRAFVSINLGSEGEEPDVLNQQRPAVLASNWASCAQGVSFDQLASSHSFLICQNDPLHIADNSIDLVITNSVPIDSGGLLGDPPIMSREIRRILASGGQWVRDGAFGFKSHECIPKLAQAPVWNGTGRAAALGV
jgi:hypothetical protein